MAVLLTMMLLMTLLLLSVMLLPPSRCLTNRGRARVAMERGRRCCSETSESEAPLLLPPADEVWSSLSLQLQSRRLSRTPSPLLPHECRALCPKEHHTMTRTLTTTSQRRRKKRNQRRKGAEVEVVAVAVVQGSGTAAAVLPRSQTSRGGVAGGVPPRKSRPRARSHLLTRHSKDSRSERSGGVCLFVFRTKINRF